VIHGGHRVNVPICIPCDSQLSIYRRFPGTVRVYNMHHNGVGGRHEMPNACGVENAIVRREDEPATSSLDSVTCGISTRSSCPNRCCPAEYSVRDSRSRCNWDEVSLRGVTLPDLPRLSRDGAGTETVLQMQTAPSCEPVANMNGSAAGFQATHVRSPPPRDCART
jgi:hypothetical protein